MTEPQAQLEDRIRRVLDEAARRVQVRPLEWHAPSSPASRSSLRPSLGTLAAIACVLVALVIGAGALVMLRHGSSDIAAPSGNPLPPAPAVAFEPHLTGRQGRYIGGAWLATGKRDHACRAVSPELTTGSASQALKSRFGVLQTPTARASRLRAVLHEKRAYGPRPTRASGQALYLNQIHLARTAFGATFYVIPAGNVSGQKGVPARCEAEQMATLRRHVAGLPRHQRTQILTAQRRYLAYLRYQAIHPEGVCATFVPAGARQLDLGDNLGCATLAQLGRWGVSFDADAELRGVPIFWTVVPDGVARVTLRFPGNQNRVRARAITLTGRPVHNVVVLAEPHGARKSGSGTTYWAAGFPSVIVLYGRDGAVIKRTTVTPNMTTLCGAGC